MSPLFYFEVETRETRPSFGEFIRFYCKLYGNNVDNINDF